MKNNNIIKIQTEIQEQIKKNIKNGWKSILAITGDVLDKIDETPIQKNNVKIALKDFLYEMIKSVKYVVIIPGNHQIRDLYKIKNNQHMYDDSIIKSNLMQILYDTKKKPLTNI